MYMFLIRKATPLLEAMLSKQNPIMASAVNAPTKMTCITLARTLKQ